MIPDNLNNDSDDEFEDENDELEDIEFESESDEVIESAMEFIQNNFPNSDETIVEVAFINWFNIKHHSELKDLSPEEAMMVAGLIFKMAQVSHMNDAIEKVKTSKQQAEEVNEIFGPVPFDEALDFLDKGAPPINEDDKENDDL